MHPALLIDEILLNIIGHCYYRADYRHGAAQELPRLARTCRAFQEPALDILWEELNDLIPLVRCLPEACLFSGEYYTFSFRLPLLQKEWDILRGYARRIRNITAGYSPWLGDEATEILSNPPCSDPLFPNLRRLRFQHIESTPSHLLHLPLPSLNSLHIGIGNLDTPSNFFKLLPESSPNVRALSLDVAWGYVAVMEPISDWVCLWQNLQTLQCPYVALNVHALKHLSRVSTLSRLSFTIRTTFHPSASALVFSYLRDLKLHSEFLDPISSFLSNVRLPTITNITVAKFNYFDSSVPSKAEFGSFLASLLTSNAPLTLQYLKLSFLHGNVNVPLLSVGDLLPCTAFRDLRYLKIVVDRVVGLSESDLLTLASSWPHLEHLYMNGRFGWKARSGLTPNRLLSILRACPLLVGLSLAIDTQDYTQRPSDESIAHLELRGKLCIDVLDSAIEKPSFQAVSAFFIGIASRTKGFDGIAWAGSGMTKPRGWDVWKNRWNSVFKQASKTCQEPSALEVRSMPMMGSLLSITADPP